jgi:unsaturated rhamnogalacturonyl hydrolase
MWDDTLMMTVLPLAKIGKLLNRPEYVEEAIISSCCMCRT